MVKIQKGTLVSSDEATVTFLILLDEKSVGLNKFILAKLDSRNLLVSHFFLENGLAIVIRELVIM